MSDPVAAPPPVAPQAQALPVNQESLSAIKTGLLGSLNGMYQQFVGAIRKFPIHPGIMEKGFSHFDDGLLWIEKAIALIEMLPVPSAVQADAAVAQEAVSAVKEVVDAVEPAAAPAAEAAPAEAVEPAPAA